MAITFSPAACGLTSINFATRVEWLHYIRGLRAQGSGTPTPFDDAPDRFPCTMVYHPTHTISGDSLNGPALSNIFLYDCVEASVPSMDTIPGLDTGRVVIEQATVLQTPSGEVTLQIQVRGPGTGTTALSYHGRDWDDPLTAASAERLRRQVEKATSIQPAYWRLAY